MKLPEGYRIKNFTELDSTNSEAFRQGEAGASSGLWVFADMQTDGKGRRGRKWVSGEGNLFASLLLRPDCSLKEASNLSFVMALSVWNTISKIMPENLKIECKWPNDILVNGKKVAGILLESSAQKNNNVDFIVLGVGINIIHYPDITTYPTTSLKYESGFELDLKEIQETLVFNTDKWIKVWQDFGFGAVRTAWLEKAHNLNHLINVNLPNNSFMGIFKGLSTDGGLIIKPEGEPERVIYSGEIFPTLGDS